MTSIFRMIGGDIFFGTAWLSDEQVQSQLDLFLREHDACLRIGDRIAARVARTAFLDLTEAVADQARWKRCASPAVSTQPVRAA